MKVRYLRAAALEALRQSIPQNLERYRSGDFSFLDLDSGQHLELPAEADAAELKNLRIPDGAGLHEAHNCVVLHKYLQALTPYDARDERLWVHLTHTSLLEYSRLRWPIPAEDAAAVNHIATHFFAKGNRQVERDNAASRLWWMAHLCSRVDDVPLDQALSAFLLRSDVRANIVERPTVAQSKNVFSVILRSLMVSCGGKQLLFNRNIFRKLMMELNSVGGFRLLDALPEAELNSIFQGIVTDRLGLKEL